MKSLLDRNRVLDLRLARRRNLIHSRLRLRGLTLAALARMHGVPRQSMYAALKDTKYPRLERIIAEAVGLSPQAIWPDRYRERAVRAARRADCSTKATEALAAEHA